MTHAAETPAGVVSSRGAARLALVVNGNARSVSAGLLETIARLVGDGDLFVSHHADESEAIARTLVERSYDTILVGGGDGTFTVVATAVVLEARLRGAPLPRFGVLRLGTGNSLAWALGAGKGGERGAGRALVADLQRLGAGAGTRDLRLVEAEGIVSPFCGFGVDAIMLRDYARVKELLSRGPLRRFAPGLLSYVIAATTRTIPSYFVRPTPRCRIVNEGSDAYRVGGGGRILEGPIRKGDVIYEGPAKVASLSTIPYYGFGFRFFPYADQRADRMQLRVSTISPLAFVRHFGAIWRGDYADPSTAFDYLVDDVSVEMSPETSFQIGGDVRGDRSRVRVRLTEPIRVVDFGAPPRA